MLKQFLFVFICFLIVRTSLSQEFVELNRYPISESSVWIVDGLNNVIISDRDRISKFDPQGKLLFEQSQKSFGRFDQLGIVNSLKLFGFSETHQLISFFDNSLTSLEKNIDLSEYELINVSAVASSSQSDKIWVFDQVNSSLHLLSMKGLLQNQQVKNLSGVLDAGNIIEILEEDNKLFVLDNKKGVYVFDVYGTLIKFIKLENASWIQVYRDYIIALKSDGLKIVSLNEDKDELQLPFEGIIVQSFFIHDDFIFLRTNKEIIKGQFIFND